MFHLTMHSIHFIYGYIWYWTYDKKNKKTSWTTLSNLHHPINGIAHTAAFVRPVVEHWSKYNIAQWVVGLFHNILINI